MITEIHTEEAFRKEIATREGLSLIVLAGHVVPPCRMMAPVMEAADAELTELVEAAGLVHDCGIKPGEAKYGAGHCTGKIQEQEGPAVARELLQKVGYAPEKIERICYLVGHHHTYNMIDGLDYQLLVEADFIVNFYEDGTPKENIAKAVERVFKTESGTKLVKTMFGL